MSHNVYTTAGIVLKKTNFGEADAVFHLLTKDFGLIIVKAKSVRYQHSKLKSGLQEYTSGVFSLIKTKNGWQVVNVFPEKFHFFESGQSSRIIISNISSFILKMIQGEQPHKEIYEILESSFEMVKNVSEDKMKSVEALTVLRILKELGYIEQNQNINSYTSNIYDWDMTTINNISNNFPFIISVVNRSIKISHL